MACFLTAQGTGVLARSSVSHPSLSNHPHPVSRIHLAGNYMKKLAIDVVILDLLIKLQWNSFKLI